MFNLPPRTIILPGLSPSLELLILFEHALDELHKEWRKLADQNKDLVARTSKHLTQAKKGLKLELRYKEAYDS